MNSTIIHEFERLIAFITDELNESKKQNDLKKYTANQFRIKQLKNILIILKKYNTKITLDNLAELKNISGVGKGTIDRISEILQTGHLSELGNYVDVNIQKKKIVEELETVVGIGNVLANELVNSGIKSVKDLIKKVNKKEIEVNDKILW